MMKMKGEIPVFRRCCFCLPLRYGLLAWGYFKMKNVRLIRVFYFVSMGMWVANFLLASFTVIKTIENMVTHNMVYFMLGHPAMAICFYFVVLAVQTYFLLLLRSEIIKLRSSGEFRFVNNAAEAECTMRCDEVVVAKETVNPDN
ncbi:hypothetical protein PYW07_012073 [Mythimna separata]|uniref:Uncharacterized protein n=1 Tax=Mythimna separata TaxID=271217 RepID=A0AAD8DSI2_MYTSE|nr:hypothetical protein PYW07_012073 [Mythimna separata]